MGSSFAVFADIIEADFIDALDGPGRKLAAVKAINLAARDARAKAGRMIRAQVKFPSSYVEPGDRRLYVSKQATRSSLEAVITARGRATSLARFVKGSPKPGAEGVYVEITPGKTTFMKRAFVIKLPQGNNSVTDTAHNLGLAVRLPQGKVLKHKLSARRVASGLYVLYGPSVSQVFRDNAGDGVASDISDGVGDQIRNEFLRLLKV